jgi:hypothetical protein
VNAKLNEEGDSSNVLPLSNFSLEYDLEETKEKDEKEDSPPESEDVPENEITSLQKIKSAFAIQRDMPVQITSKMMMEGAGKARKRGINEHPLIPTDYPLFRLFPSFLLNHIPKTNLTKVRHCLNHPLHLVSHSLSLCPVCVSLF